MAALYSKKQLAYERSIGLVLSDYDNENFYNDNDNSTTHNWTKDQFEEWLSSKSWLESVKQHHREQFKGSITIGAGGISY
jgi:hypothetical protein